MKKQNPFHSLSPSFFSGLLDDPLLFIRVPPPEQNILVDCGQMNHLAKRTLKSVGSLFISHAHMDHFIGIDKFTRSILVSPKTVEIFGPPEISDKLAAKLSGYDWNLVESFYCRFRVHEVGEKTISVFSLAGAEGFIKRFVETRSHLDSHLIESRSFIAEGALCDHKIRTLIFRISEKPLFLIDEERIRQRGFIRGPWIRAMKHHFYNGSLPGSHMEIERRDGQQPFIIQDSDVPNFYQEICRGQSVSSIGYLTDVGFTKDNIGRILDLFKGVTLLVCECTYLSAEYDKARRSYHLCTSDLNVLIRELKPEYILPMHLSKTYLERTHLLYEELEIPEECQLIKLPDRITPEPFNPIDTPDLLVGSEQRN